MTSGDAARIGDRLRRIRHQQGLSLADVQKRSSGVWKAVVIGAYERGDRSITIARLARLAEFYGVPLTDLLPEGRPRVVDDEEDEDRVVLDLTRLDVDDRCFEAVGRFADHVRRVRGDHNGRVLTLRGGDLATIALALGSDGDQLRAELADRGALLGG